MSNKEIQVLEDQARNQIRTNAKSFLHNGVSHTVHVTPGAFVDTVEIRTFGRGGARLVHSFTIDSTS